MDKELHICLKKKGEASDCLNCELYKRSFCAIMVQELDMAINGNLKGLPDDDIKDIIANTIEGIQNGIGNFRGGYAPRFRLWARGIINNKRADFFRDEEKNKRIRESYAKEKYKIITVKDKETEDLEIDVANKEDFVKKESIVVNDFKKFLSTVIEEMIKQGDDRCVKLILDYYNGLKRGLSQNEMAKERVEIPNSFNQALGRCLKKIREKLKPNKIFEEMREHLK